MFVREIRSSIVRGALYMLLLPKSHITNLYYLSDIGRQPLSPATSFTPCPLSLTIVHTVLYKTSCFHVM